VARAHGGEVRVRSAPGEGSEFTLVLPVRQPAEAVAAAAVKGDGEAGGAPEARPALQAGGVLAPGRTTMEEL
jgi:hypothetical protein